MFFCWLVYSYLVDFVVSGNSEPPRYFLRRFKSPSKPIVRYEKYNHNNSINNGYYIYFFIYIMEQAY